MLIETDHRKELGENESLEGWMYSFLKVPAKYCRGT